MDKGIHNVDENPDADEGRKVLRIIDIRVGDILISGCGGFIEYIHWEMKE